MQNTIVIRTLWITRKSEPDWPPELIESRDQYLMEDNYAGWVDACNKALDSLGDDLKDWHYIDLVVPANEITSPFEATTVQVVRATSVEQDES